MAMVELESNSWIFLTDSSFFSLIIPCSLTYSVAGCPEPCRGKKKAPGCCPEPATNSSWWLTDLPRQANALSPRDTCYLWQHFNYSIASIITYPARQRSYCQPLVGRILVAIHSLCGLW